MNIIVHCSIADINFTNLNFLEFYMRTVYYILICCVLVWLTVLYHTHCTYVCLS